MITAKGDRMITAKGGRAGINRRPYEPYRMTMMTP